MPIAFFLLNTPSYILRFISSGMAFTGRPMPAYQISLIYVGNLCHYSNFAMNLPLYAMSSVNFRQAFVRMLAQMRAAMLPAVFQFDPNNYADCAKFGASIP